ncbi:hypothetical protein LEMLEM_LOCUS16524, partial [Lemmus lemmus]
ERRQPGSPRSFSLLGGTDFPWSGWSDAKQDMRPWQPDLNSSRWHAPWMEWNVYFLEDL